VSCNILRPYDPEPPAHLYAYSRKRPDLIFQAGDTVDLFFVPSIRPVEARWSLHHNCVNVPFVRGPGEGQMDHSVRVSIPARDLDPGFYDVRLTVRATASREESGVATFGYRVGERQTAESRPRDMAEFWNDALDRHGVEPETEILPRGLFNREAIRRYNVEAASIPEETDPEGYTHDTVELEKLWFRAPGNRRLCGWLARPASGGPFPGLLVLPGAGCAPLPAPLEHARHGYAALMLQIHGQDVEGVDFKTPSQYLKGPSGGGLEDDYYFNVFLGCAQALEVLGAREDVYDRRLAAIGASQGGLLALVAGALSGNLRAVASSLCFYSNWPHQDQVQRLNETGSSSGPTPPPFDRSDARQNHLSYYDAMNLASLVDAPTIMMGSLCDRTSSPTSVHAAYLNLAASEKELHWSPGTEHDHVIAFERRMWRWLEMHL
jgi:cephalosporin-C deacetylase